METEICKREGKENKIYINEFSKVIFLNNGIRFLFRSTFFFKRHICWIKEGLQSTFDYQLNCALCDVIWPMRNSFKVHLLGSLWLKHCAMPTSKNEEKLSYSTPAPDSCTYRESLEKHVLKRLSPLEDWFQHLSSASVCHNGYYWTKTKETKNLPSTAGVDSYKNASVS